MPYQSGTVPGIEEMHEALIKFVAGYGSIFISGYTGVGTGDVVEVAGTPETVTEEITAVCIDATTFSMSGSVTGPMPNLTIDKLYVSAKMQALVRTGPTPFAPGDTAVFWAVAGGMPLAERWEVIRYTGMTKISASSFLANYEPWTAFKGPYHNHANGWACALGAISNSWLKWKMVRPFDFTRISIQGSPTINESPKDFALQYSEDGVTWFDRTVWTGITWTASQTKELAIVGSSPGPKLYWRIFITANNGNASYVRINAVNFPELSYTADFNYARRPAAWLKAPGLTGLDPCYVNTQLYDRPTDDYYNIAVTGATGFVGAANFDNQPGARSAMAVPMWNQPIAYWLSANGQRAILTAKIDTTYVQMYVGKIMTYGTPGQYPYPMLVAASLPSASASRYSAAAVNLPFKGNRSSMSLRSTSGAWINPYAWPYTKSSGTPDTFRPVNGEYSLLPISLHDSANTYGVLDGLQFITGFDNAVENTASVGPENWIVLQETIKNGLSDFYAQRIQ